MTSLSLILSALIIANILVGVDTYSLNQTYGNQITRATYTDTNLVQDSIIYGQALPRAEEVPIETLIFNIAGEEGVKVAWCESRFDHLAKNPNSTASGLFQFLNGTWEANCQGNVLNALDNAKCFKKLYSLHPEWWECR